jgi:hypothetical protein
MATEILLEVSTCAQRSSPVRMIEARAAYKIPVTNMGGALLLRKNDQFPASLAAE